MKHGRKAGLFFGLALLALVTACPTDDDDGGGSGGGGGMVSHHFGWVLVLLAFSLWKGVALLAVDPSISADICLRSNTAPETAAVSGKKGG
jgi:hypothetical protein